MITQKKYYSIKETAAAVGKCTRTISTMVKAGKIKTVTLCKRKEIPASEVQRLLTIDNS